MAWLVFVFLSLIPYLSVAEGLAVAKPGCRTKCGDVDVPYPFGIDPGCFLEGFNLNCSKNATDGTYMLLIGNVEVLEILLTTGQARMNNHISWQCYDNETNKTTNSTWSKDFMSTQYRISHQNKFVTIGCDTLAYNTMFDYKLDEYRTACGSNCYSQESLADGSCSGIGCCEAPIPPGIQFSSVSFDKNFNSSSVSYFSRCSYAVVMEADNFTFSTSYVTRYEFWDKYNGRAPILIDWSIGNETCEVASKRSNYVCVSTNSVCVNQQNGMGYVCNCSYGYEGNPYLNNGCQDINECVYNSTCSGSEICENRPGSFECSCPPGTHGNTNNTGECYKTENTSLRVKLAVGTSVGLMVALILGALVYLVLERRKVATIKDKNFQQYGGHMLYHEMKSKQGFAFTIFKEEELKEATNNFDAKNILGEGGNGTVYKGTLKNNKDVAIKRCKTINERQKKEFGKEILILSEINHKNIVKILGCCLEVEIPILVYEFIPKGNLFDLIHSCRAPCISLSIRLRIAQEAAEALAYLHSWASPSIVHRDVKSSNILLDENFVAKVSDFGASVLAPMDEDQYMTLVQGTRGYLDPEYMQTGLLTVKSDVYSFGVVLLELLTRKKAFYLDKPDDQRSLSSIFLSAMKESKLEEILDDQIIDVESMNLINGVAELARECLNIEGEKRPEMREVAEALDRLRKTMKHHWVHDNPEDIESRLGETSNYKEVEMTSYHSIEESAMLAMESGR